MPNSTISFAPPVSRSSASNLAAASNLEELFACIPRTFVAFYRDSLKKQKELGIKISQCRHAKNTLISNQQKKTFPSYVLGAIKIPSVQVCKEFYQSEAHQSWLAGANDKVLELRHAFLAEAIALKQQEESYLLSLIAVDHLVPANNGVLAGAWDVLRVSFGQDPFNAEPLFIKDEYQMCVDAGVSWFQRAMSFGLTSHQQEMSAQLQKLSLKKDADVEMVASSHNDIKRLIEETVAAALSKAGKGTAKAKSTAKPKRGNKKGKTDCKHGDLECNNLDSQLYPLPQGIQSNLYSSPQKFQGLGSKRATTLGLQPQAQKSSNKRRKRRWEWEKEERQAIQRIDSSLVNRRPLKASIISSYPAAFFKESPAARWKWLLLHSSVDYVDSLSALQCDVFQGPSISLPDEIKHVLSLNGKFILHKPMKKALVAQAYLPLLKAVRTQFFFKDRPINPSYIPQFHIKQDGWEPPVMPHYLEGALYKVKTELSNQLACMPNTPKSNTNPCTSKVLGFLTEMKYLVKLTDKNLGLSVISLDWYMQQCYMHLSNASAYSQAPSTMLDGLDYQLQAIVDLPYLPAPLRKWIQTTTRLLPRFYVIPKVHKTPWASRPIVPSHSWITSRVAEVVDYCLQPLLVEHPYVLNSSKTFVESISKLHLQTGVKYWLVTGDVTAMYTNIPPYRALDVIKGLAHKLNSGVRKAELLKMLEFVLYGSFFTFDNHLYKQKSGLAMGVACAPIVANLYCARTEKDRLKYRGPVVFFCRYIDDIFMIIKGSRATVSKILDDWKYPGLTITWDIQEDATHFLDVHITLLKDKLVTSIFEKALNKHMYIPYSSAHPLHVKKAFVKAERMRYRTLCSNRAGSLAFERKLFLNLLRRAYPHRVLSGWFKSELTPREKPDIRFIIKSEYNPVWERMNLRPVREILDKVSDSDFDNLSVMLSLKRGLNMYDLFNRNNLALVATATNP